jgi:hypothetical protein
LDLLGVVAEFGLHRPLNRRGELVATGVPLGYQRLDDPADFAEGLVDVGRVLAGELDYFDYTPSRIPRETHIVGKDRDLP